MGRTYRCWYYIEKKFKKRDDLEEYKKKILDKYEFIKTEVLFIHNWYLLRWCIMRNA